MNAVRLIFLGVMVFAWHRACADPSIPSLADEMGSHYTRENAVCVQRRSSDGAVLTSMTLNPTSPGDRVLIGELWDAMGKARPRGTMDSPPSRTATTYSVAFSADGNDESFFVTSYGLVSLFNGELYLEYDADELRNWAEHITAPEMEDDFSPGLFFGAVIALVFLVAMAILLLIAAALAVAVGLAGAAAGGALLGVGVLCSSVLAGLAARRASMGFRVLLAQLCLLFTIPATIGASWLVSHFGHFGLNPWVILFGGAAAGLLSGLALAAVVDTMFGLLLRLLPARYQAW